MNSLEVHELAKMFPPLDKQELLALAEDLKRNGQRQPVIIFEGRILDGRNRYEASKLAGLKSLRIEQFDPSKAGCSPANFVISQNLRRRHLSVGQRAAVGLEWSDQWAAELEKSGASIPNPADGAQHKGLIQETASKIGIDHQRIYEVRTIRAADKQLYEEVRAGTRSLNEALCLVRKNTEIHPESVRDVPGNAKQGKPARIKARNAGLDPAKVAIACNGAIVTAALQSSPAINEAQLNLQSTLADLLDLARRLNKGFQVDLGLCVVHLVIK